MIRLYHHNECKQKPWNVFSHVLMNALFMSRCLEWRTAQPVLAVLEITITWEVLSVLQLRWISVSEVIENEQAAQWICRFLHSHGHRWMVGNVLWHHCEAKQVKNVGNFLQNGAFCILEEIRCQLKAMQEYQEDRQDGEMGNVLPSTCKAKWKITTNSWILNRLDWHS